MRDHGQAAQAEEIRAAVGVWIEPVAQTACGGADEQPAELGPAAGADRGPVEATQPSDLDQPRGEHGTGVPGGNSRICSALADEPARDDERAVALGPDGLGGFLVHRDRRRGLDELESTGVKTLRA